MNGDLAAQNPTETDNINGVGEQKYTEMRNLRAISGNHRSVIGIDASGGWRKHANATTLGVFRRVHSGYMLALGITEENQIALYDPAQALKRFPEIEPALNARNIIWADGAGDGTDPKFYGFVAWIVPE